jgi:purine-binding chemotaxis protein CheW
MQNRTEKVVAVRVGHESSQEGSNLFFLFTARQVEEVLTGVVMRALPFAPPSLLGMAQWRGHLLPIVDLEKQLGLPDNEQRTDYRYLVVRTGLFGITGDGQVVRCILRLSASIQPIDVPDCGEAQESEVMGMDASLVRGIFRLDDAIYIIPDLASILGGDVSY